MTDIYYQIGVRGKSLEVTLVNVLVGLRSYLGRDEMEPKVLEEIGKHFRQEAIEFNWEPIRKQPKRFAILYPIIGYIISLLAIIFMGLGVFMWVFLISGAILFFGGIYCTNGIIREYRKIEGSTECPKYPSEIECLSGI